MFTEWSRPYVHLDPGEPAQHKLILTFREGAVRNEKLSDGGPPVYDRVYQVEVAAVGQKHSRPRYTMMKIVQGKEEPNKELVTITDPATGNRRAVTVYERFRRAFEEWRANVEPTTSGTPLEHWPLMTTELVRAYKDANILSVEDLASAPDSAREHIRGEFFKYRTKAQVWLEEARKDGADVKARAELADANRRIAELEQHVARLTAAANAERPEPQRKRKRDETVTIPASAFDVEEERL